VTAARLSWLESASGERLPRCPDRVNLWPLLYYAVDVGRR
jgi:hypothetical protein